MLNAYGATYTDTSPPSPIYNVDADFDQDGVVGFSDFSAALNYASALPTGAISDHGPGGVRNAIGYSGYHFDPAAGPRGMYLSRHRWYCPELGAWVTRDPVGYINGMGLYEYVAGDPLYWVDPMGTWKWLDRTWEKVKDGWKDWKETVQDPNFWDALPGSIKDEAVDQLIRQPWDEMKCRWTSKSA